MTSKRFTDEFKAEAAKQVSERRYPVMEVAERLSMSSHSLYAWLRERGVSRDARKAQKERPGAGERPAACRVASRRRGARHFKKAAAYFAKG